MILTTFFLIFFFFFRLQNTDKTTAYFFLSVQRPPRHSYIIQSNNSGFQGENKYLDWGFTGLHRMHKHKGFFLLSSFQLGAKSPCWALLLTATLKLWFGTCGVLGWYLLFHVPKAQAGTRNGILDYQLVTDVTGPESWPLVSISKDKIISLPPVGHAFVMMFLGICLTVSWDIRELGGDKHLLGTLLNEQNYA